MPHFQRKYFFFKQLTEFLAAFGKKQNSAQVTSGDKSVKYNFKGQEKFANAAKCYICEKKFGMGTKRHHW